MELLICTEMPKESCQFITDLQRAKTFNSLLLNYLILDILIILNLSIILRLLIILIILIISIILIILIILIIFIISIYLIDWLIIHSIRNSLIASGNFPSWKRGYWNQFYGVLGVQQNCTYFVFHDFSVPFAATRKVLCCFQMHFLCKF